MRPSQVRMRVSSVRGGGRRVDSRFMVIRPRPSLWMMDALVFFSPILAVVAWYEIGSAAGVALGVVLGGFIVRELLVSARIANGRVRVRNRLWSCTFDTDQVCGVGSVGITNGTGQSGGALVFYLRDGSAVPVVASSSPGFGRRVERLQLSVARLLEVPVVVRASRAEIDAALATVREQGPGRFARRGWSVVPDFLAVALSPEEAGVVMPSRLRRGIFGDALIDPKNQPELVEFCE